MFFTLLIVTFVISVIVCYLVVRLFDTPIASIFSRIIQEDISDAWVKYIKFAAFVVGVSGGVRIYNLEQYINAPNTDQNILTLNLDSWTLEVYRTIIETLQAIAWMYLIVFIFALIAYVIVKGFELRAASRDRKEKVGLGIA